MNPIKLVIRETDQSTDKNLSKDMGNKEQTWTQISALTLSYVSYLYSLSFNFLKNQTGTLLVSIWGIKKKRQKKTNKPTT